MSRRSLHSICPLEDHLVRGKSKGSMPYKEQRTQFPLFLRERKHVEGNNNRERKAGYTNESVEETVFQSTIVACLIIYKIYIAFILIQKQCTP